MNYKILAVIAALIIVSALIIGTRMTDYDNQDEIKIGFIGPLTGSYAIIGIENLRGIQLAVDEINSHGGINGRSVKIVNEDDQYAPAKTLNAFEKLTSVDGVTYFFTVSYSGFLSIAPRADERKIIVIESLDTSGEIAAAGDYVFGVGVYDEGIGFRLAEFVYEDLGKRRAAIIFNNEDAFPFLVRNSFKERFENLGGTLTSIQEYGSETKDFRSHITKLQAGEPEVVVLAGYDEAGFILRQSSEVGFNTAFLGIDTTLSEGFRKNAGEAYEGIYFTSWESDNKTTEDAFVESYHRKYGEKPQQILFVVTGYDAMRALAEAMKDSKFSTEQVKTNLYALKDFTGISGTLTMSKDGIVRTIEESMFRVQDGKPVRIE